MRGRLEGLCLAGSGAWLCPQGAASSGLFKQAKLLFCPLHPSQGIVLMDLLTCCSSHCCTKLAGLEVPVRQLKAVSSGKDGEKTGPGHPSAEVELTLLSTGNGLLPTHISGVSPGEQELSLSPCQGLPVQSTSLFANRGFTPQPILIRTQHRHQLTEQHLETAQAAW